MNQDKIAFLHTVDLFAGLLLPDVEAIGRELHSRTVASSEILFLEGSMSKTFYIIAAGRVELYKISPDGREQTLFVLRPRDFFDIQPLIDHEPHSVSATAMTDLRLYTIGEQRMVELLQRYPAMGNTLLPYMNRMLRQLTMLASDLAFTDVSTRLARLILQYAQAEGESKSGGIDLAWGLSHRQIAHQVGTAREVVTRALRHFEDEKIIQGSRGHLLIKDWQKLRDLTLQPN